jgi:hypothetical protein
LKFFLDNNLPPVWGPALNPLAVQEGNEVHHLRDRFKPDVTDVEWIDELGRQGDWTIISGDIRISRNQHEREAWLRSGMVAFFMGKSWRSLRFWEQTWRVVRWWPNITQQAKLVTPPAGFEIPPSFRSGKFRPMLISR